MEVCDLQGVEGDEAPVTCASESCVWNGTEIINIPMSELLSAVQHSSRAERRDLMRQLVAKGCQPQAVDGAMAIYEGLKLISEKYQLDGLTVRCFDLLSTCRSTGCMGVALLNDEGLIAGCEGDVSALLSMMLLGYLTERTVFMANVSRLDAAKNTVVLAHYSLPLSMVDSYEFDTHFESGIGVGIRGRFALGEATLFRMAADCRRYFVSSAKIDENLSEQNLCRTQIRLQLNASVQQLLQQPLGNHHVMCIGDYSDLVEQFFQLL